jgi:hypothetical protein
METCRTPSEGKKEEREIRREWAKGTRGQRKGAKG